ncbi:MAG TPA: hypothetical protein VNA89_16310 [Gemmatimonadaceae bacterium]|nr:hypothetical protein [Gemmatimonadaceae bacterium]
MDRMDRNDDPRDLGEATPSDRDALVGDTAASDRLTDAPALEEGREAKPPRTEGKIATPRFGSAGSGGAELEPGPERP